MADYLFVAQMDIPREKEDDFNRIYDTEHVPMILKVPGVRRCIRYELVSSKIEGTPKYLAVYQVDSPDIPYGLEFRDASDTGNWKPEIRPHTTNRKHAIYKVILDQSED
jgi:hypothetical protein